jgi:hypothetical protein
MGREREKNGKSPKSIEEVLSKLSDEKLCGNFDEIFRLVPVVKETSCGISFISGPFLQKFVTYLLGLFFFLFHLHSLPLKQ